MTAVLAPAAPVRTPRGERTAERILDAAEELFAEHGYAGTTLRDVASRVGLRNPSLYNHFESKDGLYAAVLERGLGPVLEALAEFVATGSDAAASAGLVERIMERLAERPNLPRLIQHETLSGGQRLTPMLRRWAAPAFANARELVSRTPAARRWREDELPLLVLAMYQVVLGYFTIAPLYRELEGEDLLTREALARQTRFLGALVATLFDDGARRESD